MSNWDAYLNSLREAYAQWWQAYTLTEVVGQQQAEAAPFSLDLMVQAFQPQEERGETPENVVQGEKREKIEQLGVLAGLRKYAAEHVLLIGRPGSGKSTALKRLLLEEAERGRSPLNPPSKRGEEEKNLTLSSVGEEKTLTSFSAEEEKTLTPSSIKKNKTPTPSSAKSEKTLTPPFLRGAGGDRIPVLIELRYLQTSILQRIQAFLQKHDPTLDVDEATLKTWLRQGKLLLLLDGLNELPSEAARQQVRVFRQDYPQAPMAFTTRDVGVGGDFGIAKKLEMQPLSEGEMREFVGKYLPEQGEQMLRQLGGRLRELGQTPLLLLMLCSLFKARGEVPPNLGLVFRQFARSYEAQFRQDVLVESRRWWQLLLERLALRMMQGRSLTELLLAISRQEAEEMLTGLLREEGFEKPRDYAMCWLEDLLNHHLIQLAGEQIEFRHQLIQEYYAAESLLKQLPQLGDDCLQREYLNYLKWTEPLALMLELVEDEAQAVRVVRLALGVDWRLGARLAGAVKPEFQGQTVGLVVGLDVPQLLTTRLLSLTQSEKAIPELVKALNDENYYVRMSAAFALGNIGSDAAIPELVKALNDEDFDVSWRAAFALGEVGSEAAIPALIPSLYKDYFRRKVIVDVLRKIGNTAIDALLQAFNYEDVRGKVANALGKIGNEAAVPALIQALNHEDFEVRSSAAYPLGKIGNEAATAALIRVLNDEGDEVRSIAAYALGKIGNETAIAALQQALNDADNEVRSSAVYALGEIGNETAVPALIQVLNDEDSELRCKAADALGKIGSDAAIPELVKALNHENSSVRESAADALGKIGSDAAIPELVKVLNDEDSYIRQRAADALGKIGSDAAIPELVKALNDEDSYVRESAADALGEIGSDAAISELVKALNHEDSVVRKRAADALGETASPELLPDLSERLKTDEEAIVINTITAIQERCQFYNYTLTQPPQPELPPTQPPSHPMFILHLSDLHFGTPADATRWHSQLSDDLHQLLTHLQPNQPPQLDALIISGDIANTSTPDEYAAAALFLNRLLPDFGLRRNQLLIVPGNHDLNWQYSDDAYQPVKRKDYPGTLNDSDILENNLIPDGNYILVPDSTQYQQRFQPFSHFHEQILGTPYSLQPKQQYQLQHFPQQNLLLLGLNSAWKLNHHSTYKTRASINPDALTNALNQINDTPTYKHSRLKIAVWHHPLTSPYEDRIKAHDFMQRLAQNGFRLALHGHIHQAGTSDYQYRTGSQIDIIAAGTFGAPVREWVPGYPLQYNLLKWQDNQLTVYTRKRSQLDGAWQPDAMWVDSDGMSARAYYDIALAPEAAKPTTAPKKNPTNPNPTPPEAVEVFFSYAHEDEDLRDELAKHLKLLERQGIISGWHDRKISAGRERAGEIDRHLNAARIILLLISADFIASDYCYDIELQRAIARHDAGEARVIPIILRPVDWQDAPFDKLRATPFGKLQPLPTQGKPVTQWRDRDEAMLDIVRSIRDAVGEVGEVRG